MEMELRRTGRDLVQAKRDVYYDLVAARERAQQLCPDYSFMSKEPVKLFDIFKKRV